MLCLELARGQDRESELDPGAYLRGAEKRLGRPKKQDSLRARSLEKLLPQKVTPKKMSCCFAAPWISLPFSRLLTKAIL